MSPKKVYKNSRNKRSPKKRSGVKRSVKRTLKRGTKRTATKSSCQNSLQRKIGINMAEYKQGRYVSPQQALAVSYSQVKKSRPSCSRYFKRR